MNLKRDLPSPASLPSAMRRLRIAEPLVMLLTILQWVVLASLTGSLIGVGCAVFLHVLFMTEGRAYDLPRWLYFLILPLGGLLNGLLMNYGYRIYPGKVEDDPIVAVNQNVGAIPFRTFWIKPLAAIITLGCGGSAGKEGPCSHIGASVAAAVGRVLGLNAEMRKRLVACGVSAGFASVFGTPIAGAIYGVEMLAIGQVRHDFLFPGVLAGVIAYEVALKLGVTYPSYAVQFPDMFSAVVFMKTVILGMACGLVGLLLIESVQRTQRGVKSLRRRFALWPPLFPVIGGFLVALCVVWMPTDYLGLSQPVMERALSGEAIPLSGFWWKIILVSLTLGSGFYGGVVTPQLVIGAVAGAAFAPLLGLPVALGAAIGIASVLASTSNAPIAALVLGIELFGSVAPLYLAGATLAAYLIIGHRSIYPQQAIAFSKSSWIFAPPGSQVGQKNVRISDQLLGLLGSRRKQQHLRVESEPAATPEDKKSD